MLIFNCTHGRSGKSLLGTVVDKIAAQLQVHGRNDDAGTFFDHVVFCSNVTYSDGGFKGGKYLLSPAQVRVNDAQPD